MKFFVARRQVEELGADAARSNEAVRQRPSARTKRKANGRNPEPPAEHLNSSRRGEVKDSPAG